MGYAKHLTFSPQLTLQFTRYINYKNRQNLTYKLHLNHFADITDEEMKHYRGLLNESYVDHKAKPFKAPQIDYHGIAVPKALDWRKYGNNPFSLGFGF